ncbi:glycerate kinase [Kitasatospora sp. NPDC058965]|uniref:glycerate kinase n=1 Tax=Kitasatospora sp. NPDC058965 TaxID=3346682 RepID=UPI0036C9F9B8
MSAPLRVVLAPGRHCAGLDAVEAARALAAGWRSVRPGDRLLVRPLADGGAGTVAAVLAGLPGTTVHQVPGCTGADARPVTGAFALLPDGTALVELATASGPAPLGRPGPPAATTRGTGETLRVALGHGVRRVLIGLGDAAGADGGTGLLGALGLRVLDTTGRVLPDGGGELFRAVRVDATGLVPPPPGGVLLLADHAGPLLGPDGAAARTALPAGADGPRSGRLERGLARLSGLLGGDPLAPGAGAGGGAGYGLSAGWGARLRPGCQVVAELVGLDAAIAAADLVLTGGPTATGEVLARAARAGVAAAVVDGPGRVESVRVRTTAAAGHRRLTRLAAQLALQQSQSATLAVSA